MSVFNHIRLLFNQADDINLTLIVQQKLHKLGCKTHIIEPNDNPVFAGQDLAKLKKSGEMYETVTAVKNHLVISATIYSDNSIYGQIGIYRRFSFNQDNWSNLIRQFSSPKVIKLNNLLVLTNELLPLADDQTELINKLRELNRKLHWIKTIKRETVSAIFDNSRDSLAKYGWLFNEELHQFTHPKYPNAIITVGQRIHKSAIYFVVNIKGQAPQRVGTAKQAMELVQQHAGHFNSIAITENERIGQTILKQLGGNKFIAMTGAKNFIWLKSGVQFDLSSRMTKNKAKRITIELVNDLYTINFYKIRGLDFTKLTSKVGITAENLASTFSSLTGLTTKL